METPLLCPWCRNPPKWFYGATPDGHYGTSVECDRDDCPSPDDAAIHVAWPYVSEDANAVKRWNDAVFLDQKKSRVIEGVGELHVGRDNQILKKVRSGKSLRAISKEIGLSAEAVRQAALRAETFATASGLTIMQVLMLDLQGNCSTVLKGRVSTRVFHAAENNGCKNLMQFISIQDCELMQMTNVSKATLADIKKLRAELVSHVNG